MISESTVAYFELTETAVHEIVLLMSLYDCGGRAEAHEILQHVRQQQYFRYSPSRLTDTLQHLPDGMYVERRERDYVLTRQGEIRLRDLCELGHASPSSARQLNRETFKRIQYLRINLGIFPFTGGRPVAAGPRVRDQDGYSVYSMALPYSPDTTTRCRLAARNTEACRISRLVLCQ